MTGAPTRSLGTAYLGGEGSVSFWIHNKQASNMVRRKLDTLVGPLSFQTDAGGLQTATPGRQKYVTVAYAGDYTDLNTLVTTTAAAYPEFSDAATDQAANETAYLYVQDMDITTEFANLSNQTMWMTIYDITKSQTDRLEVAGNEALLYNPEQTWLNGVDEQRISSGTQVLAPEYVGALPTDSKRFCQEWHIHQTTYVCLGPGDLHQHHVRYGVNSFISPSDLKRANAGETGFTQIATFLKGTTYAMLVVFHGQVCVADGGATATFGQADIAYVTRKRYKWKYAFKDFEFRKGETNMPIFQAQVLNTRTGNVEAYEDADP